VHPAYAALESTIPTTAVAISPDNQAFTVTYSDFAVQGHGQAAHKDCTLTVRVNPPAGYTYGIDETTGLLNLTGSAP